jgi:preprotein translocase subunit SecF
MGWHLFISICPGVVGTTVSAAFGTTPAWAAGIGLIVFVVYWVLLFGWRYIDGGDVYDLFDW